MAHVVVFGARGRLGIEITNAVAATGAAVTAVASAATTRWAMNVTYYATRRSTPASALHDLFASADAVVIAAPLTDRAIHEVALNAGCHLVDVSIDPAQIESVLALDDFAREAGVSVVMGAGVAPGLTGLLGETLQAEMGEETRVEICLIQSSNGTAGEQGTREMIDMLTQRRGATRCHTVAPVRQRPQLTRAFALPTPEAALVSGSTTRYFTCFDTERLNRTIRFLMGIRIVIPGLYRLLRNTIAVRKAAADRPDAETVVLSATALSKEEEPVSWRALELQSDYGATAAIAVGTALAVIDGTFPAGTGLLMKMTKLASVLAYPSVREVLVKSVTQTKS